jgi:hypothetical protein
MAHSPELGAAAEALASMYEELLAGLPPTPAADWVLDSLFESIEAIDTLLEGQLGPRARGVLGTTCTA